MAGMRKMRTMKEPNLSAGSQHQEGQVLPGAPGLTGQGAAQSEVNSK